MAQNGYVPAPTEASKPSKSSSSKPEAKSDTHQDYGTAEPEENLSREQTFAEKFTNLFGLSKKQSILQRNPGLGKGLLDQTSSAPTKKL